MSTELQRRTLNGETMGTRWSVTLYAAPDADLRQLESDLQNAVGRIDAQMSLWKPESDLNRLNAAPLGTWIDIPPEMARVLALGAEIGRKSGGAFDMAVGDAVRAWGFGPDAPARERIRAASTTARCPAHEALDLTERAVRKTMKVTLDLNGIAKGFGVDALAEQLLAAGYEHALVGIDGELRAMSLRPDAKPWAIAIERPVERLRTPHSVLTLHEGAVASSGDYRHVLQLGARRFSHSFDPKRGLPLEAGPASVSVVAKSCAEADAWATALLVQGVETGSRTARREGLSALFLMRGPGEDISAHGVGPAFAPSGANLPTPPLS